jgi:hypothetical protein
MTDRWLSQQEAAELIRRRLQASVGLAQATLKAAKVSGEIRSRPRRESVDHMGAISSILGITDNRLVTPRFGVPHDIELSEDDLTDWLDRRAPRSKSAATKTEKRTRRKSPKYTKRAPAKKAIDTLWPDGKIPTELLNGLLCTKVRGWLKSNVPELPTLSDETILRAAGRK